MKDFTIWEELLNRDYDNFWDFDVVIDQSYLNVNRIHPVKQAGVYHFIECAKQDPCIHYIIVFGSSVRFECMNRSDIDFLIVRDDDKIRIDAQVCGIGSETDILFDSVIDSQFRTIIVNTGVVVYRR